MSSRLPWGNRRATPAEEVPLPREREPGELPLVAAVTMARDEGAMIRRWAQHYIRELGAENVFVIDDHSSDGSTDDLGCTVLRYPYLRKYNFEVSRIGILNGLSSSLLYAYDAVLFADADEFVVADPQRHAGLRQFVATTEGRDAVGVMGFNVVHDLERESALDFDRPFLEQRRFAKFVQLMCKPSLKWNRIDWGRASHGIKCPYQIDDDLIMFHMKFADLDQLKASAANRHALNQGENRAKGTSWEQSGDSMVAILEQINADLDPEAVKRFRPRQELVDGIVQVRGDLWKAVGDGQVVAMRKRPFARIPERFASLV
ncbi:glycosyltransferase family 2 protein [Nocardioides panacisoli]|uniref:Glycosyltransferase family 2 protein n=1 Tax=Nocardioides panacisoli TaxID=627624 RepID=A0ABP7ITF9_9ACTN